MPANDGANDQKHENFRAHLSLKPFQFKYDFFYYLLF